MFFTLQFLKVLLVLLNFLDRGLARSIDVATACRLRLWKYDTTKHEVLNSRVPDNPETFVEAPSGPVPLTAVHLKTRSKVVRLVLEGGIFLEGAEGHLVATPFGYCQQMQHLKRGDVVATRKGPKRVVRMEDTGRAEHLFDLTVATEDKLYWSGDVLSHNSITSAIFIVWYLLNHTERNVMCVSQNGDKVKELMDKIDVILRGLPFYMKLGLVTNNLMTKVFENKCKLVAQTTTENSGASFTIHLLYCDEFALVNPNYIREFYRAVYPTLTSSDISRMIITSTPRGMNKFYEIYKDAIDSKSEFNPIRVDWYEIEGRDESWKAKQIANLGTEDDFNQEFGNQFLSGSSLLLKTASLKKMKALQTHFKLNEAITEQLAELEIGYEDAIVWHPQFDITQLRNRACRFAVSIDLGDGNGGDYTIFSVYQLLPMSQIEIEAMQVFTDHLDFFKLVQVGQWRSNQTQLPEAARLLYHVIIDIMVQDCTKVVLEMNHEGNYFKHLVDNIYGEDNEIEDDYLYATFGKDPKDDNDPQVQTRKKQGLVQNSATKDYSCKVIKDKLKQNQIVPLEFMTVEEGISFAKSKSGVYTSQTGHDDAFVAAMNLVHYLLTQDFAEQVDELIEFVPKGFMKLVNKKLNIPEKELKHWEDREEDDFDDFDDIL